MEAAKIAHYIKLCSTKGGATSNRRATCTNVEVVIKVQGKEPLRDHRQTKVQLFLQSLTPSKASGVPHRLPLKIQIHF